MPKKKTIILIDGSNFYFKLKQLKLQNLLNFNFTEFLKDLSDKETLVGSTYYVGAVRTDGTKKSQKNFNSQRKLLAHLKKHGVDYSLGYLMKNDGKLHEKGVDVKMAVDILSTAYEKTANKIILISSDTDLEPAISKAQSKGVSVQYIGFTQLPSKAMQRFCDTHRLLSKKQLEKYIS